MYHLQALVPLFVFAILKTAEILGPFSEPPICC